MLGAIAIVAEMGHDRPDWWPIFPLLWLLVIGTLVFLAVKRGWGRRGPDPKAILGERYARGEIGVEEYRERLSNLR